MDAVEMIKERNRMCATYSECTGCPISWARNGRNLGCDDYVNQFPELAVDKIYAWSIARKITNEQKFKEVFGKSCFDLKCAVPIAWWDEEYKEPTAF